MNRKGGDRRKSRAKTRKNSSERGKFSVRSFFQAFKEGDSVQLAINPSYQRGTFPLRYHGFRGTVKEKKGTSYAVEIVDQTKAKKFTVHPIHLKRL